MAEASDDVWADVAAEREELADLLDALTPEQWDAPSLCAEWRVRDVVGHLVEGTNPTSLGRIMFGIAKHRFSVNKMIASDAKALGAKPTAEIVTQLRANVGARVLPPLTKPIAMLADTLIHHQDIRRPLEKPRKIPTDRLVLVLDQMAPQSAVVGNKRRIKGLTLVAIDMDWRHGTGPEVRGMGEALLMAMCGRAVGADELGGEGVEILRSR
jgi:uncharacterized protein (TIGR03083 family)